MKKSILVSLTAFLFLSISKNSYAFQEKYKQAYKIATQFLAEEQIPGMSISVSHKGKIIWSEGFGFANLKEQLKVIPNSTQFRIASISKTLTAAAMAKLVDDGKLDFDESLYTYVPDFPKKKYDFTIRQLGGHIAGIRHYKGNEFLLNKKMSIVEGLDVFKDSPLLFKPGTNYKYSTYGWNLLSVVVQNASGVDYIEYMKDNIFIPLNMQNTSLDFSDKEIPNRTLFYMKRNGKVMIGPKVSNEFKAAGGGFIATSEDLIRFGNEIINPTILSKKSISELVRTQKTSSGRDTKYGIGFRVEKIKNTTRYSHTGGGVGASAYLLMYPDKDIVISIVTNLSGVNIRKLGSGLENVFIE